MGFGISPSVADGSITTAKLANLAVTAGKLAADAAETAKIKDGAATAAKLEDALKYGGWRRIGRVNVAAGGAASIDFSSIATGYRWLMALASLRSHDANLGTIQLRVNNDAASTYAWRGYYQTGGACTVYDATDTGYFHGGVTRVSTGNEFSLQSLLLNNHAGVSQVNGVVECRNQEGDHNYRFAVNWPSSVEINRLTWLLAGSTYGENSEVQLFGQVAV